MVLGNTYWERKHLELAALANAAGVEMPRVSTVDELVSEKQRLRALVVARFFAAHPELTESNLPREPLRLAGATLRWSYRRFDQRLSLRPSYVHPRLGGVAFLLLTGSGMAAVSAVLESLEGNISLPIDSYFETLRVAGPRAVIDAPAEILYVDSICAADRTQAPLDGVLAVVFDTTCYDADSEKILSLVERCRAAHVPCVLVRSHLKLDCLGTEYGPLGSIIVTIPDRAHVAWARRLRSRVLDRLALTGGGFRPEALFPVDARALTQERNRVIEQNHARAAARLRCAPTGVTMPHHGRFFILRPVLDGLWAGSRYLTRLLVALQQNDLAVREAPSFGYDFIALTLLRVPERRQASIRVSLPDFDEETIDRAIDVINEEASGWLPTREP